MLVLCVFWYGMYVRDLTYPTMALLTPFLRPHCALQSRLESSIVMGGASVSSALEEVRHCISTAVEKRKESISDYGAHDEKSFESSPRLVAVSKKQEVELLLAAYESGQRVFGENYVQV